MFAWLFNGFKGLFLALFAGLVELFSKRGTIIAASFTATATIIAAYLKVTHDLIPALPNIPSTVLIVWSCVMPSNALACLTAVISVRFWRFIYQHVLQKLRDATLYSMPGK